MNDIYIYVMAYVYKHTRLDNNEIFYIGIGSDKYYSRASSHKGRNSLWNKIVNKAGYKIDIIYDNLTNEEACEKEKELIKIIGRICFNEGTLSNITDGGEGFLSHHSEKTKQKISDNLTGKTYEEIHGENADLERLKRSSAAKKQWESISKEERKEISKKSGDKQKGIPKKFNKIVCPHCNKEGKDNVMYRWHFDKCKLKNI